MLKLQKKGVFVIKEIHLFKKVYVVLNSLEVTSAAYVVYLNLV